MKIGLTDNEIVKDKVIGGNYHPAFGYLVRSRAFYLGIKTLIDTHALKGDIVIHINKIDIDFSIFESFLEKKEKMGSISLINVFIVSLMFEKNICSFSFAKH